MKTRLRLNRRNLAQTSLRALVADGAILKLEGYLDGKKVITKMMSGAGVDRQLHVEPDDRELVGDGIDSCNFVDRFSFVVAQSLVVNLVTKRNILNLARSNSSKIKKVTK